MVLKFKGMVRVSAVIFFISTADTLDMSEHGATLGANDQPRFTTNNRDFTTKKLDCELFSQIRNVYNEYHKYYVIHGYIMVLRNDFGQCKRLLTIIVYYVSIL